MEKEEFELPVGLRFIVNELIYEVIAEYSCEGCAFYIAEEQHCTAKRSEVGLCGGGIRKDGTDVIFVEIGEVK